jgi:Ulp1 family protease
MLHLKVEENCESRELDLERAVSTSPTLSHVSKQESNFQTLSDDEQDDGNQQENFYLSKSGEKFPFSKADLKGLRPNEWLNDSILNFYLQYVK